MKQLALFLAVSSCLFAGQTENKIQQAGSNGKYSFVYLYKDSPENQEFAAAMQKSDSKAEPIFVDVNSSEEKAFIKRYNLKSVPLPFVLVIAPNGAIMRGFPKNFTEEELLASFASPTVEKSLKALQTRQLLFLCFEQEGDGVKAFRTDPKYSKATTTVIVDKTKDAAFLNQVGVTTDKGAVFLAPPGRVVATFDSNVNKQEIEKTLEKSLKSCCPGGCCEGGCCQ
jgi:hypothetical protein